MPAGPSQAEIERAAGVLRDGGLVVFPTDTVYGIGADLRNAAAIDAIFRKKGRPADRPVPVLVADVNAARALTTTWPPRADELSRKHWPGPLTLVLPAVDWIPPGVLAGGTTVGVRCPDHPVALGLLRAFGSALAVTSANRSGAPSPVSADDARQSLDLGDVVVLDAGPCPGGAASTVLEIGHEGRPDRVLREGPLSAGELGLARS